MRAANRGFAPDVRTERSVFRHDACEDSGDEACGKDR